MKGVERLVEVVQGDFAIVGLTREGVYATRGSGRKPLILGKKDGTYAVSSESNSFENTGLEIVRDVKPGEIVLLNQEGIHSKRELDLSPIKYGTFEWIYTAYPPSVIDGKSVSEVRKAVGRALAETAALIFTSGYVDRMPESIFDSGRSLSIHIYDLTMNVPGGDVNAYKTSLVLVVLILITNTLLNASLTRWYRKRIAL